MALNYQDVINRQLELSYAAPQNFFFASELMPDLVFTAQQIDIPVLTIGEARLPNNQNVNAYLPGDSLDYGTLDITFLVDKEFRTYQALLAWLKGVSNPEAFVQNFNWLQDNASIPGGINWQNGTSDLFVYATDPGLQPLLEWKFLNAYPVSVDGPVFDSTDGDTQYLTARVSFRYLYFQCTQYVNGAKQPSTTV